MNKKLKLNKENLFFIAVIVFLLLIFILPSQKNDYYNFSGRVTSVSYSENGDIYISANDTTSKDPHAESSFVIKKRTHIKYHESKNEKVINVSDIVYINTKNKKESESYIVKDISVYPPEMFPPEN